MEQTVNYKTIFSLPIVLILAATCSSVAVGETYYIRADGLAVTKVDATSCADATTAMNVAVHNAVTFAPDDVVRLCDTGGVYKSSVIVPSSGSDGHPITYNNADGATPVIDLSMEVESANWTDEGDGVWSHQGHGRIFWEDDVPLKAHDGTGGPADGEWHYSTGSGVLYYNPSTGTPADHTIRTMWFGGGGWLPAGIDLRNRSNITVHGLTINRTGVGISHGQDLKNTVPLIKNLEFYDNTMTLCMWGIWSEVIDNGVEQDVNIHHNTMDHCNSGISSWTNSDTTPGHTQRHLRYSVSHNNILNLNSMTSDKRWTDSLLSSWYYTDHEAISFQDIQDSVISDNNITTSFTVDIASDADWCRAVYFYLTNGAPTTGNKILRNNIYGHYYPSIYVSTGADFTGFENNIYAYNVINNPLPDKGYIAFGMNTQNDNPLTGTNYFVNNTLYAPLEGGGISFNKTNLVGTWVLKNNIHYGQSLVVLNNASSGSATINHNIYPMVNGWPFAVGTSGMTFVSWLKGTAFDHVGSSVVDPLFADAAAGDFRLQASSPAINAGEYVPAVHDGVTLDGTPDIGAYEYGVNDLGPIPYPQPTPNPAPTPPNGGSPVPPSGDSLPASGNPTPKSSPVPATSNTKAKTGRFSSSTGGGASGGSIRSK